MCACADDFVLAMRMLDTGDAILQLVTRAIMYALALGLYM
jgi:hypothetical protein